MRQFYTISELTQEFEISTRTLRFYEAEGLITPIRRGRQRLYRAGERTRLKLILRGKRLGFTLAEIAEIVSMYRSTPGEAGQLRLLLAKIDQRRSELSQKRQDIEETLAELQTVEEGCNERLRQMGGDQ
jgi:DNA-binding transcriptional MerR regulator